MAAVFHFHWYFRIFKRDYVVRIPSILLINKEKKPLCFIYGLKYVQWSYSHCFVLEKAAVCSTGRYHGCVDTMTYSQC